MCQLKKEEQQFLLHHKQLSNLPIHSRDDEEELARHDLWQ